MSFESDPAGENAREPVFNAAAWPVLAIVAVILGGYAAQGLFPEEVVAARWAFSPADLIEGRWVTLVTALFLHGSWGHAILNAASAFAFGTPVARALGLRLRG